MSEQRQHLPHQSRASRGLARKGRRPFTSLQRTQQDAPHVSLTHIQWTHSTHNTATRNHMVTKHCIHKQGGCMFKAHGQYTGHNTDTQ